MNGYLAAIIILTLCSTFFSATETAFSSANKIKLKNLAADDNKRAAHALALCEDFDRLITAVLVGNTISNITMTDREIIYILRSGQYEMAFNALVKQYSERLYWHVRRFLCCHEDTDDLLQDIFVKIWKGLPSFRADSQIFTWIYRIATNEVLNHLRKGRILSVIRLDSPAENLIRKIDDDPYFNGDALQRELQKAIQKLPDKQKLVFNLRYFDEMKYEEISEITGTSVGALKASYHHAYNKIKAELEEKFIDK
jgi:RNA polymerase sigma-70 factor (ECF subfamily)